MTIINPDLPREDRCDICGAKFVCSKNDYFWVSEGFNRQTWDGCKKCIANYYKVFLDVKHYYRELQ